MIIVDQSGRIVLVNQQVERWFGFAREELIGRSIELLVPQRLQDRHRVDRQNYLQTPIPRPMGAGHELSGCRKDGSEFPVDVSLHPMETTEGMLVLAHIVDLTGQRNADVELQRRHAMERLAMFGQLAGGVTHELRNPLSVIRNAAYYLESMGDALDADVRSVVGEIQREVDRANTILGDLLDYARDPPQRTATFDVVSWMRTIRGRAPTLPRAAIEVVSAVDALEVSADPDQIDRILLNLVQNGAQASAGNAPLVIRLTASDDQAHIDVIDAGPGVRPADRDRIFDPLFTTKAEGIGLGLTISKWYAERNGGTLELIDGPHVGAAFRLSLPLVKREG